MVNKATDMMFTLDIGNGWVKAYANRNAHGKSIKMPHALAVVTPDDFNLMMAQATPEQKLNLVQTDAGYFFVGELAQQRQMTKRINAAKYDEDYYGVLLAGAIAQLTAPDFKTVSIMASHSPADISLSDRLMAMLKTRRHFVVGGQHYRFGVSNAYTYVEPMGGYLCSTLVDGNTDLKHGRCAIIDIGWGTFSIYRVGLNGLKDSAPVSSPIGMGTVEKSLETLIKKALPQAKNSSWLDADSLRHALVSGKFVGWGNRNGFDVQEQVNQALVPLLNELNTMYNVHLGGGTGVDYIVLTGGGSALIKHQIASITGFDNRSIVLATKQDMQYANVQGAHRMHELILERENKNG